ncbi:MAG: ribosome biogenesis GTPase Der [bacterium]
MSTKNTPDPIIPSAHPVVAIVGRPNVGKSALFNRILGRRLAIVHEECGVTRDRIVARSEWNGKSFDLVDTGGLTTFNRATHANVIEAETRQQAEAAIEDATVVILVVDVEAGILPVDQEVERLIHRKGTPAVVAVNKCDNPDRGDMEAATFERLGFPAFSVSALHNIGLQELLDHVAGLLPKAPPEPVQNPLKIAIVGRPNVGKSSFINRIIHRQRVIVSDVPGTTRDSIDIPFTIGSGPTARHYMLTDTAGMRKLGKVDGAVERYSVFRAQASIERADIAVLLLDATQGPTAHDKTIASLIEKEEKGCVVIVNKWDLLAEKATQKEYRDALSRAVPFLHWVPIIFVSAKDGYNMRQCLDTIDHVAEQIQTRIPTGLLNRAIMKAYERVQPPVLAGKRFKIYYSTQLGIKPIRIGLFVNDPKRLPDTYREYLVNSMRKNFGLQGAPIIFIPKERSRAQFVAKPD